MFRALQFVLAVAALLGMSAVVQADHVPILVDTTSSAVVFNTGFEAPANTVGSNPGTPDVGTGWTYNNTNSTIKVGGPATLTGVSAYEGSQYLNFYANGGGFAEIMADGVAANSGVNDWITMTIGFRMYSTTTVNYMYFSPRNGTTDLTTIYIDNVPGNTGRVQVYTGSSYVLLTQTYPTYQWNTFVLKHKNGTEDWSCSTDGSAFETVTAAAFPADLTLNWCNINIGANGVSQQQVLYDAVPVPEPSALVLLFAAGLIGPLCYAWRKRK